MARALWDNERRSGDLSPPQVRAALFLFHRQDPAIGKLGRQALNALNHEGPAEASEQ